MRGASSLPKQIIARRVAAELKDGDVVNLGIGLPTLVADYVPSDITVVLQSENGMIGMGPSPEAGHEDHDIVDAGGTFSTLLPGGAFFDSTFSFGLIRGRHIDVCVLGALQVDSHGNLASWIIPGVMVAGMGGAMDLVTGAKRVIVAMQHTAKGTPKILENCTLPLTAVGEVDLIVTELAVMTVEDGGIVVKEIRDGVSVEELQSSTEARLHIERDVGVMAV